MTASTPSLQGLFKQLLLPLRDQEPVSRLIRHTARKEWRLIGLTFFSSLLQAACEGLTLGVMFLAVEVLSKPATSLVDLASKPLFKGLPQASEFLNSLTSFQAFTYLLTLAVLLKLLQAAGMYLGGVANGYFGNRVSRRITSMLHSQILDYTFSCASRYRVGDLQYVNNAGPGAVVSEINNFNGIFLTILLLFTYLLVLLRLSPWLLIAAVGLGGISMIVQKVLLPRVERRALLNASLGTELTSRMTENIQGLRLLHTTGFLDDAALEVDRQTHFLEHNQRAISRLLAINGPLTLVMPMIMIAVIAWLSIIFFGQRSSGILPSLVTFVVALQRLNGSIGAIADAMLRFKSNSANLRLLNAFLVPGNKEFRRKGGLPYEGLSNEISLHDVCLSYSADLKPALQNVNIHIPAGHTIALVGSSGAGKSSIADLLAALYQPSAGIISIDGINLHELNLASWQKRIGVVSQDTFLFNASIAENISFGTPLASMDDIRFAAKQAQASVFIETLPDGLNTLVGERGYRLSGGQRQRISLARAILRNPDLLILDEATSALDTESERLVQEAIDRFDRKHTILVIAHRLSTIVNADRIYVLEEGRVIEQGNHKELLEKGGRYARLWQQQVKTNTATV
ncbi:MAG: ABC transporter ATP-binding protein [Cyanobium sp.]